MGLILIMEKCKVSVMNIEFLGHDISKVYPKEVYPKEGIGSIKSRIEAIGENSSSKDTN